MAKFLSKRVKKQKVKNDDFAAVRTTRRVDGRNPVKLRKHTPQQIQSIKKVHIKS